VTTHEDAKRVHNLIGEAQRCLEAAAHLAGVAKITVTPGKTLVTFAPLTPGGRVTLKIFDGIPDVPTIRTLVHPCKQQS
jgi:hypothetical protein